MGVYQIFVNSDCAKGWAFVRDYTGNLVYYGSVDDCKKFIDDVTGFGMEDKVQNVSDRN